MVRALKGVRVESGSVRLLVEVVAEAAMISCDAWYPRSMISSSLNGVFGSTGWLSSSRDWISSRRGSTFTCSSVGLFSSFVPKTR